MENAEIDRLVMKPTARRRLGKYVLLGRLGHGGMGKIYLAYAPGPAGIEKLLVVKRLHSHLTSDPVLVNSFLDEARLSMALNHPNIVNTFDVGEVDGRFFMVMEYIDGQNLGVLLRTAKRSGEYPPSVLWAGVFLSVLDGLHAAHVAKDARGRHLQIIHRDVSPQNVLVTNEGLVKLVDFGIAKAAMRVSETDAGVLKGKYAYMSPEQVRGDPLDARSDVFAAGIVLWEMLAGRRLYKADTIVRSVERILTEPPISPVRVNADCDPDVARLAFKALQKDREQRFSSALEFREALEEVVRKSAKRTRQSDVRDLMVRLFGDVIERQRAVLETCLSQVDGDAHAPIAADLAGGDDDDDGASRGKNDSESDLSLLKLKGRDGSEVTTPSAIRASPLVTGEGEQRAENAMSPATSMDRPAKGRGSTRSSGTRAGVVLDGASAPVAPAPLVAGSFPGAARTVPDFGEATATASAPPPPRRSPVVPVFAGAVVIALASVAFAVVVDPWGDKTAALELPPVVAPAVAPPDPVKPDAAPVVAAAPTTVPAPPGDAALAAPTTAPPSTDPAPPVPAPVKDAVTARTDPEPTVDERDKRKRPVVARADNGGDKRDRGDKGADKGADKGGDKGGDKGDAKAGEQASDGTLTLDTVPWTVVYLGKKKLGETPLNKVPVPAGALELLLVNPEANVRETYIANVKPGAEYRARLDLN